MGSSGILFAEMKVLAGIVAAAIASPVPVIIGGQNAVDGQFPHQVTLKRSSGSHFCGGSVIAPTKVMCAAHCKQSSTNFSAGAGAVGINSQRQVQKIANQLPHPQYNSRLIEWDYMIITIAGEWDFSTEFVKPIAIVSPMDDELPDGTPCQTSGYGYSQHINGNPGTIASTLQWIDLQCITNRECKKTWLLQTLTSRQQCAEVDNGTSCMGDSGGPLTTMENGAKVLLGNVSWGHSKCAVNGYPGAYSRNADPTAHAWIMTNAGL